MAILAGSNKTFRHQQIIQFSGLVDVNLEKLPGISQVQLPSSLVLLNQLPLQMEVGLRLEPTVRTQLHMWRKTDLKLAKDSERLCKPIVTQCPAMDPNHPPPPKKTLHRQVNDTKFQMS